MPQINARLFGGLELSDANAAELTLNTRKARALLAFLIVGADRWHTRDRLAGLLWSDRQQAQARHSLTQALGTIRKLAEAVGITLIESDNERVRLLADAVSADTLSFQQNLHGDAANAAKLYAGPLLDGFTALDAAFDEWLATERAAFHEQACTALRSAIDHAEARSETAKAIAAAKRWVALDPYAEPVHRRLMSLLAANGDRAEAIRQYQSCAQLLRDELGVEPSAETTALLEDIRVPTNTVEPSVKMEPTPTLPKTSALPLPDRPSIAVLPFDNLSNDPEQEFFADGVTEDITISLSRFPTIFVIARSSMFTYKGSTVDIDRLSRQLGVRYVLEGRVRTAGDRIRISAELVDAQAGNHLWAERYDRKLTDIFAVQDEVTEAIVTAIAPQIGHAERRRVLRKPTESLDAWGFYQRGLAAYYQPTSASLQSAIELFDKSIELDPTFAHAIAMAAEARYRVSRQVWRTDDEDLISQAIQRSRKAISLEPHDPLCLAVHGHVLSFAGQHEGAISTLEEALVLNPNDATAHHWLGRAMYAAGRAEEAILQFDVALRLSPHDPYSASFYIMRALSFAFLERYEDCVQSARQATESPNPPRIWADAILAAGLSKLNRSEEANATLNDAIRRDPDFSLRIVHEVTRYHSPEVARRFIQFFRAAGVPE